jgi:CheY-like chemotaxis protein
MKSDRSLVLIVDDEPDMCWVLQNLLAERGYDFRVAQTGETALGLIQSTKFDIALLDVKLTDIDGLELAGRLKSVDSSIHIVMISGYYYKDDVDIQRAIDGGVVSGFIAKPFQHDEVIGMLEAVGRQ